MKISIRIDNYALKLAQLPLHNIKAEVIISDVLSLTQSNTYACDSHACCG